MIWCSGSQIYCASDPSIKIQDCRALSPGISKLYEVRSENCVPDKFPRDIVATGVGFIP